MKISVLIAASHAGPHLTQALSSLAAQTHADWELIVLEHGSRDGTEETLRAFGASHPGVRYEHVPGTCDATAHNRLLELATGDAVAFLDPRDTWQPQHLAVASQELAAGADVVVANLRLQEPKSDRVTREIAPPAQLASAAVRTLFVRDAVTTLSGVVVRRAVAFAAGRFDPRFALADARDLLLRCAVHGARFVTTQQPTCACVRPRPNAEERARLAEQAVQFYETHRDLAAVPAALRRRLLAGSLVAQGRLLRPIDPTRAARCFWRAWSLQPVHVQTLGQFALTGWRLAGPVESSETT